MSVYRQLVTLKKYIFLILISQMMFLSINAQEALKIGDQAFLFSAKDQNGQMVNLSKQLEKGPVVLFFYRGSWCPYCNKQMKEIADSIGLIKAKGATVIAITPETTASMQKIINKTNPNFSLLHDEQYQIMKGYKVNFDVDANTINRYQAMNLSLSETNGNTDVKLPVPATYIIGKDGKIKFAYFNKDYRKRVSVAELLINLN